MTTVTESPERGVERSRSFNFPFSIFNFFRSEWLTVRVGIALGTIFVAAALPKIADPPSFAHMIYNYRILPSGLVNISALTMPWVELLAGLALILGVWVRPARWILTAMLVVFMIAIS